MVVEEMLDWLEGQLWKAIVLPATLLGMEIVKRSRMSDDEFLAHIERQRQESERQRQESERLAALARPPARKRKPVKQQQEQERHDDLDGIPF